MAFTLVILVKRRPANRDRWLPKFHAPLVLIDPVMADNGKLYKGFSAAYVATMQQLAHRATVLTPNITEAQLLLDEKPTTLTDPSAVTALAKRLHALSRN